MRVLEARFHPRKKADEGYVVVGHVYCSRHHAAVEPTRGEREGAMIEKLQSIVRGSGPNPFERLCSLASDDWSFVEVF